MQWRRAGASSTERAVVPRWRAAFAAGVIGLAAVGCAATEASSPPPTIGLSTDFGDDLGFELPVDLDRSASGPAVDSVLMIGDSITAGARNELEAAFSAAGFQSVRIEAVPGKRVAVGRNDNPGGVDVATSVRATDADHDGELWVVALGTNDIAQYSDAASFARVVAEMMAQVPAEVPLVWVNTYWQSRLDDTAMVNEVIRSAVLARGNAVVADWHALAGREQVLTGDGVHPNGTGNRAFAALTTQTVVDFISASR